MASIQRRGSNPESSGADSLPHDFSALGAQRSNATWKIACFSVKLYTRTTLRLAGGACQAGSECVVVATLTENMHYLIDRMVQFEITWTPR